jgi:hypothetical protein
MVSSFAPCHCAAWALRHQGEEDETMLSGPEDAHAPRECDAPAVIGLTLNEEFAFRRRLRKTCPSEPWVEAQFKTAYDKDAEGRAIRYRYHDPHVFPPGGERTKMIRCPACGIWMPPNAFENGKCLDHAKHEAWRQSPSALAIEILRRRKRRRKEIELEPEDMISLREEMAKLCIYRKKITRSL